MTKKITLAVLAIVLGKSISIVENGIYAMFVDGASITTPVKEPEVNLSDFYEGNPWPGTGTFTDNDKALWANNFNLMYGNSGAVNANGTIITVTSRNGDDVEDSERFAVRKWNAETGDESAQFHFDALRAGTEQPQVGACAFRAARGHMLSTPAVMAQQQPFRFVIRKRSGAVRTLRNEAAIAAEYEFRESALVQQKYRLLTSREHLAKQACEPLREHRTRPIAKLRRHVDDLDRWQRALVHTLWHHDTPPLLARRTLVERFNRRRGRTQHKLSCL